MHVVAQIIQTLIRPLTRGQSRNLVVRGNLNAVKITSIGIKPQLNRVIPLYLRLLKNIRLLILPIRKVCCQSHLLL